MPACWGQQCGATMVITPLQLEGKEVSAIRTTTPVQQGQKYLCNVGNGTSATRATTPLWQWLRPLRINDGGNAIVLRATSPACRQQQFHCNEGNNVIAMTAKTPGLQRCLCIDDSNTIAMRVTMPSWRQWRRLRIDDIIDPIVTRAVTPAQWLCKLDHGRDPIAMRATNTIATMAKTLAHQWQQCHCKEGNNAIAMRVRTNNASLRTAMTPSQQGQQCHRGSRATTPLLQEQQCQLDGGKDACTLTTAMTPLSWGQQSQLQWWQTTCALMATMPSQRGQRRQLDNKQQGQQC
jgi:hypothetical protein